MSKWIWSGLRTGIKTTRYPSAEDAAAGISPGLPTGRALGNGDPARIVERCPTGALFREAQRIAVDVRRCVHCYRCARGDDTIAWDPGYEWAMSNPDGQDTSVHESADFGAAFTRSVHIRVVDAGDCGACLHEVKQLSTPYYNLHRLGFFFTPTPRQADILLVVGAGSEQMREALVKTHNAMPTPRKVIAVGACALSGGVFGPNFACSAGVREIVPVDIEVPGNPPPPLAILHALLVATGRATSAEWNTLGVSSGPPAGGHR